MEIEIGITAVVGMILWQNIFDRCMGGMHYCRKRGCGGFDACDDDVGNDDCCCSNAAMTTLFEFDRPMLVGKPMPAKCPFNNMVKLYQQNKPSSTLIDVDKKNQF